MIAWAVFMLMAGAVLAAFRAVVVRSLAEDGRRRGVLSSFGDDAARSKALRWWIASAACLVLLSLGGLWRVAQAVGR